MKLSKLCWQEITIRGHKKAFVVLSGGRELGTISKLDSVSAWQVWIGIGMESRLVGTQPTKQHAKNQLAYRLEKCGYLTAAS